MRAASVSGVLQPMTRGLSHSQLEQTLQNFPATFHPPQSKLSNLSCLTIEMARRIIVSPPFNAKKEGLST